jgi:hypothetical protein
MRKITLLLLLTLTSLSYSQEPITVTIEGSCNFASGIFNYNGLVNGKNNYVQTVIDEGTPFVIGVGFDGVKWVLYADGDLTDDGFDNIAVPSTLLPPFTGWVNSGCVDGTMTISQNLNTADQYLKNTTLYPNPSSDYITFENATSENSSFSYIIYDLVGRSVAVGNSKFNEKISIEKLTIGNYLIQIKNEEGKISNNKLIKK